MQVATILQGKGQDVETIGRSAPVAEAVQRLRDRNIGALVVSEDGRKVLGILSERDVVHALAERGAELLKVPVAELMTEEVTTCGLNDAGRNLLGIMTERRIRHIPVVENGELCGMISIGDVVKSRLDEITHEAEALREYIAQN